MPAAALAVALSAFLLFLVQPLAGKAVLPWFGGSAAVWSAAMLLFQGLLLLGYGWAHLLVTRVPARLQPVVHLCGVGLVVLVVVARGLTVSPDAAWAPPVEADPTLYVLGALATSVGLPYLVLATTSPLVQAWIARAGVDPVRVWRLAAVSNAASFAALLAYPFGVAPLFELPTQARLWAVGFVLAAALLALVACRARAVAPLAAPPPGAAAGPAPGLAARASWVVLPAAGTTLLLAETAYLCEDVVVVPTLWVLPLALYLLSWVVAFAGPGGYRRSLAWPALGLALAGSAWTLSTRADQVPAWVRAGAGLAAVALGCLALHGEVARLRPRDPAQATGFWLWTAGGGALGGAFVALAAPALFATRLELPLVLTALPALVGGAAACDPAWRGGLTTPRVRAWTLLGFAGATLVLGAWLAEPQRELRRDTLVVARSFYGTHRVIERPVLLDGQPRRLRMLLHGGTLHGGEVIGGPAPGPVIGYYGPSSGVGQLLRRRISGERPFRLGVIGLGIGSLTAYTRPGDVIRYYELDPLVGALARDLFTFLRSRPQAAVVLGDARRSLEAEPPQAFDVLVVDAFSGDAVPAHLLTLEAFAVYRRHLAPGGVLALHVTSRSLDLTRVVGPAAARLGLAATLIEDPARFEALIYRSRWVLAAEDPATLAGVGGRPLSASSGQPWTDSWTDVLAAVR